MIVAVSPAAVRAAKSATAVIPIVANDLESDPVASGFVNSIAHPGGNITGVFSDFPEFGMKWLELLKEAMPALSNVVVLWDSATGPMPTGRGRISGPIAQGQTGGDGNTGHHEIGRVFATAGERRPDAIVILSSPIFGINPS